MNLNFLASKYRIVGRKGEGTFSEVLQCENIQNGGYFACKKMRQKYNSWEQVNRLREVQAMRRLHGHDNILQLTEVIFDKRSGTLVLICELMDQNLYEFIKGRKKHLPDPLVRSLMWQMIKSIEFLHRNGIFHRDIKPENILIKDDKLLKLADFGSCRGIYSKPPYTEYISTRWYRSPECLLTEGCYSYKMDVWSAGCVFFEILSFRPLFPGSNEVDQIAKIHNVLGTPSQTVLDRLTSKVKTINFNFPEKRGQGLAKMIPHISREAMDLLYELLVYDPERRISASRSLRHSYFKQNRTEERKSKLAAADKNKENTAITNASCRSMDTCNHKLTGNVKDNKLKDMENTKSREAANDRVHEKASNGRLTEEDNKLTEKINESTMPNGSCTSYDDRSIPEVAKSAKSEFKYSISAISKHEIKNHLKGNARHRKLQFLENDKQSDDNSKDPILPRLSFQSFDPKQVCSPRKAVKLPSIQNNSSRASSFASTIRN